VLALHCRVYFVKIRVQHGSTTLPILRTVASSLHDSHSTPPSSKLNLRDIDEMNGTEIIELLNEADSIEDQGAVVHYLWMNKLAYTS
jgi:hypothetical protein